MKIILVTGTAGFIGYHTALSLLSKGHKIIGIDEINDYYSKKIKLKRIKILKKNKRFIFIKRKIEIYQTLKPIFLKYKIDIIINLAAQAGVAYSKKNPTKYFDSNIKGFFNICLLSKEYKIKKVIYASSSSVYGDSKKLPVKETEILRPLNFYGLSKKNNEETANYFTTISNTNFIGLRFFSIYGTFGRPDMIIYKLLNCFYQKKSFFLNNKGNHSRDFTHINLVTKFICKLITKKINKHEVFNICSQKKISLLKLIKIFKNNKVLPKIVYRGFQSGDIKDSMGNSLKMKTILKFKQSNFDQEVKNIINWYKANFQIYR